jgi:hypothetical protein
MVAVLPGEAIAVTELDALRTWLHRSGYPLEFRVAAAFREAGFTVYQGVHYPAENPEAVGARDIDVLAVREEFTQKHPMTRSSVIFVVECKTSPVPWVLFRSNAEGGKWEAVGSLRMNAVSDLDVLGALDLEQDPWALRMPANAAFGAAAVAGKGRVGVQDGGGSDSGPGRSSQRDFAFDAIRQVVSAADGILHESPAHIPSVAIPVVVVSARLYALSFAGETEEIIEVPWERILWRGDRTAASRAVDIVSEKGLASYVGEGATGALELLPILRAAALGRRQDEMRLQLDAGRVERLVIRIVDGVSAAERRVANAIKAVVSKVR